MSFSVQQRMQSSISSGLRLIKALDQRIAQTPTLYLRLGSHVDDPKTAVSIMDWVAAYFTDSNDSAAAAMSVNDAKHVTLHIACNKSPETLSKASKLANAIQTLAGLEKPFINSANEHKGYNVVRNLLVDTCWPTVWNKILAVRGILREPRAMDHFESMIQKWSDCCKKENRPFNCSPYLNDDGNAAHTLKRLLSELRNITEDAAKSARIDWKLEAFDTSGSNCDDILFSDIIMSALDYSDRVELPENFVEYSSDSSDEGDHEAKGDAEQRTDPNWMGTLSIDELRLLQRFVNAVQELYKYTNGALMLATDGAKFFRSCWGETIKTTPFSNLFTVAWVHDEYKMPHEITSKFETLPMDWVKVTFDVFAGQHRLLTGEEHGVLEPICKGLWKKDDCISGKVHEEMVMALFLVEKKIKVHHGAVGISAPPCYACGLFYEQMSGSFLIRKKSHTIRTDWILPSLNGSKKLMTALTDTQMALSLGFSCIVKDYLADWQRIHHPDPDVDDIFMLSSLINVAAC